MKLELIQFPFEGVAYRLAEFFYSRTMFRRKHAAIDYARLKMPDTFLFPKKLCASEKFSLNVTLNEDKLMLDDKEIPWFKDGLNAEQKKAVTYALKVSQIVDKYIKK